MNGLLMVAMAVALFGTRVGTKPRVDETTIVAHANLPFAAAAIPLTGMMGWMYLPLGILYFACSAGMILSTRRKPMRRFWFNGIARDDHARLLAIVEGVTGLRGQEQTRSQTFGIEEGRGFILVHSPMGWFCSLILRDPFQTATLQQLRRTIRSNCRGAGLLGGIIVPATAVLSAVAYAAIVAPLV
jgi:hypothetical protein